MTAYQDVQTALTQAPKRWLITGVAGFIGSHLLEKLLNLGQEVVGLDNFATGSKANLAAVAELVGNKRWQNFRFIEGDIRDLATCQQAVQGVDYVLHQAALGSVPRSLNDPLTSHLVNVDGFVHMLLASRDAKIKRFVYAASSSTYGDHPALPKVEENIGKPLSPYAATKYINEVYAEVFSRCYGVATMGLRYFNVFGPRQDPHGAYAAVMPLWFAGLLTHQPVYINGDGETSRDFCFVANAVQANLLAATAPLAQNHEVFNVAVGERTDLNQLYRWIRDAVAVADPSVQEIEPIYRDFRAGDVQHSLADISKANQLLGYQPTHRVPDGLAVAAPWYIQYWRDQR